jgi:serine/threonine protein kinase
MTLQPGTRLGSYEITSLLGSSGMGQVYRAKDLKLGREVAIKVLLEEFASDSERLRRFEQEARSPSALNHPNIITKCEYEGSQGPGLQRGATRHHECPSTSERGAGITSPLLPQEAGTRDYFRVIQVIVCKGRKTQTFQASI